ncbi:MAG: SDR family NAD(P)-dependent oxidoreductase, partial [Desulfobacteraceae bacterium]|nr:SDR family NAD(P)-dependent oxidoreductase [Desulfobacteraceae bacterium]
FRDLETRSGRPIRQTRFCGLGAVKTNIGHLEPASGIAGLMKVLLSMKHGLLPGTPHLEELNPYIEIENTPFFVVRRATPWKRRTDERGRPIPYRAGISSFGFGGANAHVIVEEFDNEDAAGRRPSNPGRQGREPRLIVLSARTEERLHAYTASLLTFVEEAAASAASGDGEELEAVSSRISRLTGAVLGVAAGDLDPNESFSSLGLDPVGLSALAEKINAEYETDLSPRTFAEWATLHQLSRHIVNLRKEQSGTGKPSDFGISLTDMAYTLQTGRDAMAHRMAVEASSIEDFHGKLARFVRTRKPGDGIHLGRAEKKPAETGRPEAGGDLDDAVGRLLQERDLDAIARLWVTGRDVDWMALYPKDRPMRLSLPTYPFAKDRYWLPAADAASRAPQAGAPSLGKEARLHPLLERNTSTLSQQRFTTLLTGDEFYLKDHVVAGNKTLPGVVYLEMARAAAALSGAADGGRLSRVVWVRPLVLAHGPEPVHIRLEPGKSGIDFVVFSTNPSGAEQIHATGKIPDRTGDLDPESLPSIDVDAVRARCPETLTGRDCYRMFRSAGIEYGPGFQVVETLYGNGREALSRWVIPETRAAGFESFVLHPSVMDGALQTVLGIMDRAKDTSGPYLPYAVGKVEWVKPLGRKGYAHAYPTEGAGAGGLTFDIDLTDDAGQPVVRIAAVTLRAATRVTDAAKKTFFRPRWEEKSIPARSGRTPARVLLLDEGGGEGGDVLWERFGAHGVRVRSGGAYRKHDDRTYVVDPEDPKGYERLFAALKKSGTLPQRIVHLLSGDAFSADGKDLDRQMAHGLHSLFHMTKALIGQGIEERTEILYFYKDRPSEGGHPLYAAMSGFARTLGSENMKLVCRTVAVSGGRPLADAAAEELRGGSGSEADREVQYRGRQRRVRRLVEFDLEPGAEPVCPLRENGVYLITGGAGGLGLIFAEHLYARVGARLVLTGRSDPDPERARRIEALRADGARILFRKADITDKGALARLQEEIRSRFGRIHGILHAAGLIRDAYLVRKDPADLAVVTAPKVLGTVCLDEAFRDEPLDFFVLFSSAAAETGNPGQCDYAFANSFMDHYALWRDAMREAGKRSGKTLSIGWPLWRDGGMRVDPKTKAFLEKTWSVAPLHADEGLKVFEAGLATGLPYFVFFKGVRQRPAEASARPAGARPRNIPHSRDPELREAVAEALRGMVSEMLKIERSAVAPDEELSAYGLDSIGFTELAERINDRFGLEITPALFFEYTNLRDLAAFLCSAFSDSLAGLFGMERPPSRPGGKPAAPGKSRFRIPAPVPEVPAIPGDSPIAVIGMDARMPGSGNTTEFWRHLIEGEDLIREVPADRWDWRALHGDPSTEPNRTRAKWGGFLTDVDRFDPLFFGISPKEAELMDPQQRLFLETVWKTIEDAGYRASDIAGTDTGLFVGVSSNDYAELLGRCASAIEAQTATGMSHALLPNRISYLLDIHGPSEPIDTACSSSLVAVHRAVEAIRSRTCDMAIAGGVNLILTPTATISFDKAGMLSPDGRCKTFDEKADGYVRGEGVGAVLLKPLDRALADGDWIYAVIRSTAINHGGKANSLTAPNPKAQARLLVDAYERARVPLHTVGYVEAHGTGTSLGDPIEVNALKKAFSQLYETAGRAMPDTPTCGLGSVKTNIGHLETAAGIAGVIKVLLALKHGQLPPTLHFDALNPYIDLAGSPFFVVAEKREWEEPVDENGTRLPRRAGVSSFGFGGANAHVVLEEFPKPDFAVAPPNGPVQEQLIVLSAKTEDRLRAYAEKLAHFLDSVPPSGPPLWSLAPIAYTLQVGREAMEERLALVAESPEDAAAKLRGFAAGSREAGAKDFWHGNARTLPLSRDLLTRGEAGKAFMERAVENCEIHTLGQLWVSGVDIDWIRLHDTAARRRIPLPTYPFAPERYWLPTAPETARPSSPDTAPSAGKPSLPLPAVGGFSEPAPLWGSTPEPVERRLESEIRQMAAEIVKLDIHRMDPTQSLGLLGFDSIFLKQLSDRIGKRLAIELPASIFFAHGTIRSLAGYLMDAFGEKIASLSAGEPKTSRAISEDPVSVGRAPAAFVPDETRGWTDADAGVAIIGASGRFPESRDLTEFWKHLEAGRHLVREVPRERWRWEDVAVDPGTGSRRAWAKWGGFIADVDRFDAAFFKISPREAELMDPQHRLFLQEVWHTLEDAGYDADALSGRRIGVFAGLQFNDYQQMLLAVSGGDAQMSTGTASAMLTNRVSFLMNWHGPSESIDTACSGSLVAVHRAVRSVQSGECEMAVAGGVSLMLSPASTIGAGKLGVLSAQGRCRTLDRNADGYVKGEGVGAVLMKPLHRAIADHDHIYAVIRGSAVNHGGKATSLTAPNSEAQAALLHAAYRRAGVDASTVTCLELHGTGTELGDPVEVDGIQKGFARLCKGGATAPGSGHTCGLGSVKSNIGHLEPAAGISGLMKIILAMQHGKLPATLHVEEVNPLISLEGTPFYIVGSTRPWHRLTDPEGNPVPRRAGISSFGFGGANAHVVVEEFDAGGAGRGAETEGEGAEAGLPGGERSEAEPQLAVLSAKNGRRLREYAERMADFLQDRESGRPSSLSLIANIAYTLQVGRQAMEERLALVVSSPAELADKLKRYALGETGVEGCFSGRVRPDRDDLDSGVDGKGGQIDIRGRIRERKLEQLARMWVDGAAMDWSLFHGSSLPFRVSLPTYPFSRDRYWLPESSQDRPPATADPERDERLWINGASRLDTASPAWRDDTTDRTKQKEGLSPRVDPRRSQAAPAVAPSAAAEVLCFKPHWKPLPAEAQPR